MWVVLSNICHVYIGFIYQKKMTALTQYNEYCYFPFLAEHQEAIVAKIQNDFAEILKKLPKESENCVVDFVLCPSEERSGLGEEDPGLRRAILDLGPGSKLKVRRQAISYAAPPVSRSSPQPEDYHNLEQTWRHHLYFYLLLLLLLLPLRIFSKIRCTLWN